MLIINEIPSAVVAAVIDTQLTGVIWLQTGPYTLCDAVTVPVFLPEHIPLQTRAAPCTHHACTAASLPGLLAAV